MSLEWVYLMFVQMFQTDIWGLGCCIYEVMTFRRAFKGKALWTIISLAWVYLMFVQMFQTDIWGLGCCIYEVMTFRRAFKGKALWTIIREIKRGKVGIQIEDSLWGLAIFSAIVSIGLSFSKHSELKGTE